MTDKNADGLIPGQPVDFETLQRIERSRKPDDLAERAKEPEVRRGRPAKATNADYN